MNKRKGLFLLATTLGVLLLAGIVWAQGEPFSLRRQSVAGGGAAMTSPNFQMRGIAGQPGPVGSAGSDNFSMMGGLLTGAGAVCMAADLTAAFVTAEPASLSGGAGEQGSRGAGENSPRRSATPVRRHSIPLTWRRGCATSAAPRCQPVYPSPSMLTAR